MKRRWAKVGSAGTEHDRKLKRELEDIYEAFRARYEGVCARAIARNAKAGTTRDNDTGPAPAHNAAGTTRDNDTGPAPAHNAAGTAGATPRHTHTNLATNPNNLRSAERQQV